MAKQKESATKVKTALMKVENTPNNEGKPFTKEMQAHPKGSKKKGVPEPAIKVEQPKVEQPAPTVTQPPVEKKVDETPKLIIPEGVTQWLSKDPLTPVDFPKIAANLYSEIDALKKEVAAIQEILSRKRKAVPNGRVSIKDVETGTVYKSKNSVYQSMLKAGSLDALVKAGTFGADPAHNTFGVYALFKAFPGRFIEVKPVEAQDKK